MAWEAGWQEPLEEDDPHGAAWDAMLGGRMARAARRGQHADTASSDGFVKGSSRRSPSASEKQDRTEPQGTRCWEVGWREPRAPSASEKQDYGERQGTRCGEAG
jgi:hypothetical protein